MSVGLRVTLVRLVFAIVALLSPDARADVNVEARRPRLDDRFFLAQRGAATPDNWWHRFGSVLTLGLRLTDRVSMQSTTYYQPRVTDFADFIVLNDNALTVAVAERVDLRLLASIRHDGAPPRYCTAPLTAAGCPPDADQRLVATDVALENALAVRF